jgi:hypothetical protein
MDLSFKENIKLINGKQFFFSEDDDFYFLKKHMFDIVNSDIKNYLSSCNNLDILEIGPCGVYDPNTPFSEFNTSKELKDICSKNNHNYYSLDIVPVDGVSYVGSVEELSTVVDKKFDVIVLLSVLEHVKNVFKVPKEIHNVLNDNGVVYMNTPLMFKTHGPIPDYWRFTEFGYEALFGDLFGLSIDSYPKGQLGKNSAALSLNVIARKK